MSKLIFTNNAIRKMTELQITENTARDVYNYGETTNLGQGSYKAAKKYQSYGYEVGIYYKVDRNGDYIITTVWQRPRR